MNSDEDGIRSVPKRITTAVHKKRRTTQDTTWGLMTLPPFAWKFIDTPVFQRLRYLNQTGMLDRVFPGATHNRFSHSLGTAFLAYKLLKTLMKNQPELEITEGELKTTILAALCHDLGHGPCSHAFDYFMKKISKKWTHERMSITLLQHLVTTENLEPLLEQEKIDLHMASEMILGSKDACPPGWKWIGPLPGREFLFDVVSNASSGMDVDKWDYLKRDGLYLKIGGSFTCERLLEHCRVIGIDSTLRLGWPSSEASNVMNMFIMRYDLHNRAYQHRVVRTIGRMCMEALYMMKDFAVGFEHKDGGKFAVTLADAHLHPDIYVKTTDWVVECALQGVLRDLSPEASALFARIHPRKLWDLAGQMPLPAGYVVSEADICTELETLSGVPREHFVVDLARINCGKGRYDPMRNIPFYEEQETECGEVVFRRVLKATDYMRPMYFQRRILRVFCRRPKDLPALEDAFERWTEVAGYGASKRTKRLKPAMDEPSSTTPAKRIVETDLT